MTSIKIFILLLFMIVFDFSIGVDNNIVPLHDFYHHNGNTNEFEEIKFLNHQLQVPSSVDDEIKNVYKLMRNTLRIFEKKGKIIEQQIEEFLRTKGTKSVQEQQRMSKVIRNKQKDFERNLIIALKPIEMKTKMVESKFRSMLKGNGNRALRELGRFQLGIIDNLLEFIKSILKYPFELLCQIIICQPSVTGIISIPTTTTISTTTTSKPTTTTTIKLPIEDETRLDFTDESVSVDSSELGTDNHEEEYELNSN